MCGRSPSRTRRGQFRLPGPLSQPHPSPKRRVARLTPADVDAELGDQACLVGEIDSLAGHRFEIEDRGVALAHEIGGGHAPGSAAFLPDLEVAGDLEARRGNAHAFERADAPPDVEADPATSVLDGLDQLREPLGRGGGGK